MTNTRRQAVMVDRDGVIVRNRDDYIKSWSEVEFIPGALDALALLTRAGHPVFVVTNQSAVGRGLMSMSDLEAIHDRLGREVEAAGGRIDGFLVCPHAPYDGCDCRKPAPGLLHRAVEDHGIDLKNCYVVGDHESDIATATAVGCPSILVLSGRTPFGSPAGDATLVASDLHAAARLILVDEASRTAAEAV
jgi:D-glycero-D-manno-heptose 1,7-bisphosphate phosphatase